MPDKHQILCINKARQMNPHERILNIGGFDRYGLR